MPIFFHSEAFTTGFIPNGLFLILVSTDYWFRFEYVRVRFEKKKKKKITDKKLDLG